jgi:hypothetical protein
MSDAAWLVLAFLANLLGMGWLALSFDKHWQQVHGGQALGVSRRRRFRIAGVVALASSLAAGFAADHASMAPLVWLMSLAVTALGIAMALAWRPRWLKPIAPLRAK